MASQWIPWVVGLQQKSEVIRMARACNVTVLEMAARCMVVWVWAQDQTVDGMIKGLSPPDVSATVGIAGMGEAMVTVGWLVDVGDAILFPNWKRFNGRSAKQRLLAAERKRRQRDEDVTPEA